MKTLFIVLLSLYPTRAALLSVLPFAQAPQLGDASPRRNQRMQTVTKCIHRFSNFRWMLVFPLQNFYKSSGSHLLVNKNSGKGKAELLLLRCSIASCIWRRVNQGRVIDVRVRYKNKMSRWCLKIEIELVKVLPTTMAHKDGVYLCFK